MKQTRKEYTGSKILVDQQGNMIQRLGLVISSEVCDDRLYIIHSVVVVEKYSILETSSSYLIKDEFVNKDDNKRKLYNHKESEVWFSMAEARRAGMPVREEER